MSVRWVSFRTDDGTIVEARPEAITTLLLVTTSEWTRVVIGGISYRTLETVEMIKRKIEEASKP